MKSVSNKTVKPFDAHASGVATGLDHFFSAAAARHDRWRNLVKAAQAWAERGGFSSANKNLDPSVYPDEILRKTASAIGEAEVFRFDLSDLQPAAFGATEGQGLWKLFQDFLKNPTDVDGIAQQMEAAAKKAYG